VGDVCRAVARPEVEVRAMPSLLMTLASPFMPIVRELRETEYQFSRPYVMDSTAITEAFGLAPSAWEDVCRRTAG
jgi:hypothetical protein